MQKAPLRSRRRNFADQTAQVTLILAPDSLLHQVLTPTDFFDGLLFGSTASAGLDRYDVTRKLPSRSLALSCLRLLSFVVV